MGIFHFAVAALSLSHLTVGVSFIDNFVPRAESPSIVNQTTCDGREYLYRGLAGYGFIPSNARDKFGDTLGGIGSSIALDRKSWKKTKSGNYEGIIWGLPDRGWNTQGTVNFQPRIHKFAIKLTPKPGASVAQPSPPNLELAYLDTILLTGPDGTPATGLDPDATGFATYPGFPILPVATYVGNGFGGPGPGGKRIAIDSEGLVLDKDGSFWVSDEYGPYVYKFSAKGRMLQAIMPPPAYIPHRNGSISFSANSPPFYDPGKTVVPADTETGRNNNQGFEGLAITPNGRHLYVMLQSALDQEGGPSSKTRRPARLLKYDISRRDPVYEEEYVVTLPVSANKVAGQSEIHFLDHKQFFILSRDSGAGHGQASSLSLYRHVDIFDISASTGATDIKSAANDATGGSIASAAGVLNAGITPALYCPFLDFNLNSELGKFGLHNGGAQDAGLLNEKWEGLALAPLDGKDGEDGEWYLFSLSDNDFVTQQGFLNFGQFTYADASGFNLDNQALVFQVKLPKDVHP